MPFSRILWPSVTNNCFFVFTLFVSKDETSLKHYCCSCTAIIMIYCFHNKECLGSIFQIKVVNYIYFSRYLHKNEAQFHDTCLYMCMLKNYSQKSNLRLHLIIVQAKWMNNQSKDLYYILFLMIVESLLSKNEYNNDQQQIDSFFNFRNLIRLKFINWTHELYARGQSGNWLSTLTALKWESFSKGE